MKSCMFSTAIVLLAALLAACAGGPSPPDWQANAKSAMDAAVAAYFAGDARVEAAAFERARSELARTGRPELMARAELMRCAARVASLAFEPCDGFEQLRHDVGVPERAYAGIVPGDVVPHRQPSGNGKGDRLGSDCTVYGLASMPHGLFRSADFAPRAGASR